MIPFFFVTLSLSLKYLFLLFLLCKIDLATIWLKKPPQTKKKKKVCKCDLYYILGVQKLDIRN